MNAVEADFWIELAHIEAEVVLINNVLGWEHVATLPKATSLGTYSKKY